MTDYKISEGTVIHATHRNQDLIPAFLTELRCHNVEIAERISKDVPHDSLVSQDVFIDPDDHPWWTSEDASYVLEELFDELNSIAPDGMYFGAIEGDGSDFGFWKFPYC